MVSWLKNLKVVVCAGTGGVGKTTVAATVGLMASQAGLRTLVLTIDPARRLADALGLSGQLGGDGAAQVPGTNGLLSAAMIDPQQIFADFVRRAAPTTEVADRLLKNRLFGELASTLSGSQEFTSLERLLSAVESGDYDLVILDTPPSQHAIDFLRAPERIFSLFQESVTKWFISGQSQGIIQQVLNRGTKTVMAALERVTGGTFLGELSEFFASMAELQGAVAKRSIAVHRLLASPDTGFVLVTAFDEAKLREAQEFSQDLQRSGHQLRAVVINRCFPQWLQADRDSRALAGGDEAIQRLMGFYDQLRDYYERRETAYSSAIQKLHGEIAVIKVPELKGNVYGMEGLVRMAATLGGPVKEGLNG